MHLATRLLNSSKILPVHFTKHGRDLHYLVRPDVQQADEDLHSLGIHTDLVTYESGINVSVHRTGYLSHRVVDVNIHANHTVIHVRYGTTVDHEMKRVLRHAKGRAESRAWERERDLLLNNLKPNYHWTEAERRAIKQNGLVDGYVADYKRQPDKYPELADDCNNIRLVPQIP